MPEFRRILITGAAGSLGSHLRTGLAPLADRLRLTDIRDLGPAAPHEELVQCDLADRAAALELARDCDAIVHFAGHPRELGFDEVMADVLPGSYHMFEGARLHGARRVVYASSIHAVGFHEVEAVPDTRAPHRPDTFYGLTKTFTEDLASLYWDKFGIESVMLRICSCFPEPRDRRMLWSWLSFPDMVRLVAAALTAIDARQVRLNLRNVTRNDPPHVVPVTAPTVYVLPGTQVSAAARGTPAATAREQQCCRDSTQDGG